MTKILDTILPLVVILSFITLVFTPGVVKSETFEGYPRTPGTIKECPLHAEYVYKALSLRKLGKTEDEMIAAEKLRWEHYRQSRTRKVDPSYWAMTEYMVAEAFKARAHVLASVPNMQEYSARYYIECRRQKSEEVQS